MLLTGDEVSGEHDQGSCAGDAPGVIEAAKKQRSEPSDSIVHRRYFTTCTSCYPFFHYPAFCCLVKQLGETSGDSLSEPEDLEQTVEQEVEPIAGQDNMSVGDIKPDVKVDSGLADANGGMRSPQDVGIIKTAPDDIKPPPLNSLFGADSPPPTKVELPASRSRSSSPAGPSRPSLNARNSSRKKAAAIEHKPLLIDDLPTAWDEAHQSFVALDKCVYETKGLGLSREQDEMMVCDCVYDKRESIPT